MTGMHRINRIKKYLVHPVNPCKKLANSKLVLQIQSLPDNAMLNIISLQGV